MNGAMATINMSFINSYNNFMAKNGDPRTESWWLMSGPGPLLTILVSYLYLCTSAGPRYMRDRKPFKLNNVMALYNLAQIGFSVFLVYEGLVSGWWNDYNYSCQPVDYSDSPKAKRMAAAVWWYFFIKIVELLDTVFFVLRKKQRQMSFLHLYHHTIMPICAWIGVKFLPGGHGTLLGVINSFIHIIMYTYYFLAIFGNRFESILKWKKYITTLQLVQFVIIFIHNTSVMFTDCNYPKFINFLLSLNASLFIYMFGKFYVVNYLNGDKKKSAAVQMNGNGVAKQNGYALKENGVANGSLTNGVNGKSYKNGVVSNEKEKEC